MWTQPVADQYNVTQKQTDNPSQNKSLLSIQTYMFLLWLVELLNHLDCFGVSL